MTQRESKEVRRKEILDAALRCFSKKGYHETRMDDIVKEAKLTKGGIYWYFKGKKEIFIAVIEEFLQEDKVFWEKLLKEYEIGEDFLIKAGLLYLRRCLTENKWEAAFWAESIAESYRDEVIKKEIDRLYKEWRRMIKDAFDYAIQRGRMKSFDTEDLSSILIAIISGLVDQYWISGGKIDYEGIWTTFCKALLEGIKKEVKEE